MYSEKFEQCNKCYYRFDCERDKATEDEFEELTDCSMYEYDDTSEVDS